MRLAGLRIGRDLLQPERAKRGRNALADTAIADPGEFHRVAADVADDAARLGPAQKDALRGEAGLFVSVDDVEPEAGFAQDLGLEFGAILGLTRGGGGDHGEGGDVHALGQKREAFQGRERTGLAFGVQPPGLRQALAEAAHDLFVVEIGRAAGRAVKDHHADRVRADIDDTDAGQGAGRRVVEQGFAEGTPVTGIVIVGKRGGSVCGHGSSPGSWGSIVQARGCGVNRLGGPNSFEGICKTFRKDLAPCPA